MTTTYERYAQIIADAELACGVTAHENPRQILGAVAHRFASVMQLAERREHPPEVVIGAIRCMGRPIAKMDPNEEQSKQWLPGEELGFDGKPREDAVIVVKECHASELVNGLDPHDVAAALIVAQSGFQKVRA